MENVLQYSNIQLHFLFNIFLCSFLRPFLLLCLRPGPLVTRRLAKAWKFLSSVMTLSVFFNIPDGHHSPVRWVANLHSSAELFPFFRAKCLVGISRSLDQYFFRWSTRVCGFILLSWVHRVGVTFLWLQAILSSYRLKPLPACTLLWYLTVEHLIKGWGDWMQSEWRCGSPSPVGPCHY